MIDLHCHLCFGVDDGPHDASEALELARALKDAGVVAELHIYSTGGHGYGLRPAASPAPAAWPRTS